MAWILTAVLTALLGALACTLLVALHRRDVSASVNALVSLVLALLSLSLATGSLSPLRGPFLTPELPVWVTAAGLLHSVGMLGPYDSCWWWDHLTHTVSATIVAALVYAGLIVAVSTGTTRALSPAAIAGATIIYTFVIGVFWELVELVARAVGERYDIEPMLVHYGWRDTAFDLAFDLVGAIIVVALDVRMFVELAALAPEVTQVLLGVTGTVITVGSVLMGVSLGVTSSLN
ncbi:hypothetical protein ACFR9U_15675 [Halorientalis brevis]|uniref:Uncharacterized protein n=1 Tax=Halorientalis brevis TaxID=1126241 RepID=A0ABD6CDP9_9EURY|nr:hypothetical protein [Halorientalis brevis]